jgi:hypothetical protein
MKAVPNCTRAIGAVNDTSFDKLTEAAAILDLIAAAGLHDREELGKGTVYTAAHAARRLVLEARGSAPCDLQIVGEAK